MLQQVIQLLLNQSDFLLNEVSVCVNIYKEIYWVIYCYIILIYLLTSKIKLSCVVSLEPFTNINKFAFSLSHQKQRFFQRECPTCEVKRNLEGRFIKQPPWEFVLILLTSFHFHSCESHGSEFRFFNNFVSIIVEQLKITKFFKKVVTFCLSFQNVLLFH
jgi:hypothetical protein